MRFLYGMQIDIALNLDSFPFELENIELLGISIDKH